MLLSFINALIHTAKELSATINKNEKYGVVMDAAMSNLDEMHIENCVDIILIIWIKLSSYLQKAA